MLRRTFLGLLGAGGISAALGKAAHAAGNKHFEGYPDSFGVLFDATRCIGCRRCEAGCNKVNELPPPPEPFDDLSVLNTKRRTHAWTYTVVNRYDHIPGAAGPGLQEVAVQALPGAGLRLVLLRQGLHQDAARAAVIWDGSVCVGCRYCMIACPFDIPTFEYDEPLTPRIMKCTLCNPQITSGQLTVPGCVGACPVEALVYGKRTDLVNIARDRIQRVSEPLPEPPLRRARNGRHQLALSLGRALQDYGHAGRPGRHPGPRTDLRGPGGRAPGGAAWPVLLLASTR